MDIEKLATAAITSSISATGFLSPYINEGDREPMWDGFIYIYNSKSKKNSNWTGRVPVQVKGRLNSDFSKEQITYSVPLDTLQGYLKDGGVVFFVVYIKEDGQATKIYWSDLLPVRIKGYLTQSKGEKTTSIELKEFPTDNTRKASVLLNFCEDRKRQASFVDADLLSIDDLENQGVLKSITMTVSGYDLDRLDPASILFNNSIYMYANILGSSIPQPLDIIPLDIHIGEEVTASITVNSVQYYTNFRRIRSKEKTVLKIGRSFEIAASSDASGRFKINYNISPILCDAEKDLRFFLAALEANVFEIDGVHFPLKPTKSELKSFNVAEQKKVLASCEKIVMLFRLLGIDTHIDTTLFSNDDRLNIAHLIHALIDKEPVSGLKDDIPFVAQLEIAGNKVALAFQHHDEPNTYFISDFFKSSVAVCCEIDGEKYPVSQYAILRKEDFLEVCNIDFSVLLPSFMDIEENQAIYGRANAMLLDLLLAYDEAGSAKPILLQTAKNFAEWLCGLGNEVYLPSAIRELNRLQVIKRERELNHDEIKSLCSIAEDGGQREDVRVGAYLLMGNQAAAEIHFEQLDPVYKQEFMQFPIFKFWHGTK